MTIWTEPEPGNLVQRMNETVRTMHAAQGRRPNPIEPVRVSRRLYEMIRASTPSGEVPSWQGIPLAIVEDPPPSYREAIGDALERKSRR